jgi:hypothetical protein
LKSIPEEDVVENVDDTINKTKTQSELVHMMSNEDDKNFKKPESNSSITIKRLEKQFDLKETIKFDNFVFFNKLSNKKSDDTIAANTPVGLMKEFDRATADINNKPLNSNQFANISRISSVESFHQFHKKLAHTTHQTSSPVPKISNFLDEFKLSKKLDSGKKIQPKNEPISSINSANIMSKNYDSKFPTSFDLYSRMSNITDNLNNFHKKVNLPTINSSSNSVYSALPFPTISSYQEPRLEKKINEV